MPFACCSSTDGCHSQYFCLRMVAIRLLLAVVTCVWIPFACKRLLYENSDILLSVVFMFNNWHLWLFVSGIAVVKLVKRYETGGDRTSTMHRLQKLNACVVHRLALGSVERSASPNTERSENPARDESCWTRSASSSCRERSASPTRVLRIACPAQACWLQCWGEQHATLQHATLQQHRRFTSVPVDSCGSCFAIPFCAWIHWKL